VRRAGLFGNGGFIKGLLGMAVLVGIAFVGISFGRPYFRYDTMRSHTKDILTSDITVLPAIREKILAEARELEVPLTDENLEVTQTQKVIRVKGKWSETVNFWDYYSKRLDFVMEVEY